MSNYFCPEPLVQYDTSKSFPSYTTLYTSGIEGCAVPCPNLDYSKDEWNQLQLTLGVIVAMAFFTSLASFLSHILEYKRFYILVMFIGGFCLNSLVFGLFLLINRDDSIVCYDDAHYIKQAPFCVFQAATLIFLFLWIEIWSVILAYDSYLYIYYYCEYGKQKKMNTDVYRKRYFIVSFVVALSVTLIPLLSNDLGYDPKANIPICFFIGTSNATSMYFWLSFFFPFYFLLLIFLILSIFGIWRINQIFVNSAPTTVVNGVQRLSALDSNLGIEDGVKLSKIEDKSENKLQQDLLAHSHIDEDLEDVNQSIYSLPGSDADWAISGHESYYTANSTNNVLVQAAAGGKMSDTSKVDRLSSGSVVSIPMGIDHDRGDDSETDNSTSISTSNDGRTKKRTSNFAKYNILLGKLWRYNGRNLVFVTLFGVTTFILLFIVVEVFAVHYQKYINSAEDFVTCLSYASVMSPTQSQEGVNSYAQQMCGNVPKSRPPLPELYSILTWCSGFGLVPAFVFGLAGKEKVLFSYLKRKMFPQNEAVK